LVPLLLRFSEVVLVVKDHSWFLLVFTHENKDGSHTIEKDTVAVCIVRR
jgi:hypothetical protein